MPSFTFSGTITPESVKPLLEWTSELGVGTGAMLYLNTTGGDFYSAIAVRDMIQAQATSLRICALGTCQAAGTIILAAARKENRYCGPSTQFMVQQPTGMFQYTLPEGEIIHRELYADIWQDDDGIRERVELYGSGYMDQLRLADIVVDLARTDLGLQQDQLIKLYGGDGVDGRYFFDATKALEYGFVSRTCF